MRAFLLAVTGLSVLTFSLPAQVSKNAKLMGTWTKGSSYRYNDCWGYTAPNGKEYALVGLRTGFSVVDITDPSKPVERGYWPGSTSTWRDVKTFGHYAYVVTEARSQGMWIIDLKDADNPKKVATWGTTAYRNCHNIAMDMERGHAWLVGTDKGALIVDVKSNPTSPKLIATYSSPYLHDVAVQHGLAHGADIYGNNYEILDVSNLPTIKRLGSVRASGTRYCHNTWPTWDDKYCATTNESANGPVGIYDITNKAAPKLISVYRAGPSSAIPHNVVITDRLLHASHYTEGYRIVDLSDPTKPVEVGYYDTWGGSSGGYNGAWGVYTGFPSGNVLANDISTGLYIVKPTATTTQYGTGTPGTGGKTPETHSFGAAWLGNANFRLDLRNGLPASAGILLVSSKTANLNLSGLMINVSLTAPGFFLLAQPSDANGEAGQALPIPSNSNLTGISLHSQWAVLDKNGKLGFSSSRGMSLELFAK
jgi:choice-of-anchor B domain-containing protein